MANQLPNILRELHQLTVDYADGDGIDFEPYQEFMRVEETRDWIRLWTGNKSLDGTEYRVFGQDGTGGLAAFWCVQPNINVLRQPVVFLGSEGQRGVVASNFWDYLWLLAGGLGPREAVEGPPAAPAAQPQFAAFAAKYAQANCATPTEIIARARAAFPSFEARIESVIR